MGLRGLILPAPPWQRSLGHSAPWPGYQQAFLQVAWLPRAGQARLADLLLSLISLVGDERQVPREDQCIRAHYSIIAVDSSAKGAAPFCCQPRQLISPQPERWPSCPLSPTTTSGLGGLCSGSYILQGFSAPIQMRRVGSGGWGAMLGPPGEQME